MSNWTDERRIDDITRRGAVESSAPSMKAIARTMAILCAHDVRSSLTWSIATFFTLFLFVCACRPRHLFTDDGEFRALGVSDPRRMSVLAAPVGVFAIATMSVFVPMIAVLSRGGYHRTRFTGPSFLPSPPARLPIPAPATSAFAYEY